MNILLTGSNGFLGKYIYNELGGFGNIYTLNSRTSNYNVDLRKDVPLFTQNFDLVIHAAGKAHLVPVTELENLSFDEINVIGTNNLLKGLLESGKPKKFVFISSVSVYGLIKGENINENNPLLAKDPYGRSKINAEKTILKWCQENNVIVTILRLPLVFGEIPPGNLGSMIKAIKKGYYFNISGGKANKSMVLATDIAKFILQAAEVGGTYNLTDGIHPTFRDVSHELSKKFGRSFVPNLPFFAAKIIAIIGDIIGINFPFNSDKLTKITCSLTFDDSKAREAFGWNPISILDSFKLKDDV
jgi:nucleoside-diphosphate-sugar epimerase